MDLTFGFKTVKVENMLDLTDPAVVAKLGVKSDDLVTGSLEITQKIGDFAVKSGYKGIIAPSVRVAGGRNVVLFENAVKALENTT